MGVLQRCVLNASGRTELCRLQTIHVVLTTPILQKFNAATQKYLFKWGYEPKK